jgi:butyrate kinase
MISRKVIFFSINPGVISKKVGVFRENGDLFEILEEIPKRQGLSNQGIPLKKTTLCKVVDSLQTSSGLYNHQSQYKRGGLLRKDKFSRAVAMFRELDIPRQTSGWVY